MSKQFQDKIYYSIEMIRKAEKLALTMQPEGLWVGFSGGKDSQVLLELVKLANVKYKAVYNVTTIDPPANVKFIRDNYPQVIFNHPKKNFFKLVETRGLPIRQKRFCCDELKENGGVGYVVLTGVRAEESAKRAAYNEVSIHSERKEHKNSTVEHSLESIMENEHRCIKGKDKIMVYPLLKWTTEDIWAFIEDNNLPRNPCYELTKRVGCMFCPFASRKEMKYYSEHFPKYKQHIIESMRIYMSRNPNQKLKTPEQYFDWWISKQSINEYIEKQKQTCLEI